MSHYIEIHFIQDNYVFDKPPLLRIIVYFCILVLSYSKIVIKFFYISLSPFLQLKTVLKICSSLDVVRRLENALIKFHHIIKFSAATEID